MSNLYQQLHYFIIYCYGPDSLIPSPERIVQPQSALGSQGSEIKGRKAELSCFSTKESGAGMAPGVIRN